MLDELARTSGKLYTDTLVYFWRIVRKKGIWLSSTDMEKIFNSKKMHAHSADASVQSFFHGVSSWRSKLLTDPKARPPRRTKKYHKIQWKQKAIRLKKGVLILSNGRGNEPLRIPWKWPLPVFVTIVYSNGEYVLHACYSVEQRAEPIGNLDAGVDLGEIHPAAVFNGKKTIIVNGRLLRSKKRALNKLKARKQRKLSTKTPMIPSVSQISMKMA